MRLRTNCYYFIIVTNRKIYIVKNSLKYMKKWMKPTTYLAIALALGNCAKHSESPKKLSYNEIQNLCKIVWNADTLIKNPNKPLYEMILPDSTFQKNLENLEDIENEYLDLKIERLKHYNNFKKTKTSDEGLKTIAYSQYLASRFPGTDGSELEKSAMVIDEISKELK